MTTITETMAADHRRCDELFSEAEEKIAKGEWPGGEQKFTDFLNAMEHHFEMEESVLFQDFEQRTGQAMGPTQMMRMEHIQMRQLFADMEQAMTAQDKERCLGLAETLMMIMKQHNMKEERMLYPMTDQAFGSDASQVLERMDQV